MEVGSSILELVRKVLIKILMVYDDDVQSEQNNIPGDVEGNFVVHTIYNNGNTESFIMASSYLIHRDFLNLLEQAEEKFGFKQRGVVAITCWHSDLERILGSTEWQEDVPLSLNGL